MFLFLGPPARCTFSPFFGWEGSPTKIDYKKKVGSLILTSLLEDLAGVPLAPFSFWIQWNWEDCPCEVRGSVLILPWHMAVAQKTGTNMEPW